jgi:PST family polysaccharide transporter
MWRELVSYGRHVLVSTVLRHGTDLAANAVVARALGTGALGQFRYTTRLASTPNSLLLAGASYVLFPAFARISSDAARLEAATLRSLRWVAVFGFATGMAMIPFGIPVAVLVFGETWRPAGEALMAMCLFPVGGAIMAVVTESLKARGRPVDLPRLNALVLVTTIGAMLALSSIGLTATVAGLSIGAAIGGAYALKLEHDVIGTAWRPMFDAVWPPALAASLVAFGVYALDIAALDAASRSVAVGLALLAAEAAIGLVAFVGVLAIVAPDLAATLVSGARSLPGRIASLRGGSPPPADPEPLPESLGP